MSDRPIFLNLPGWRNFGPEHWQSVWSESLAGALRALQDNWTNPTKDEWVKLFAQSLACIAAVHLPIDSHKRSQFVEFAQAAFQPLSYRSRVVASKDDPYCSYKMTPAFARCWGSEFRCLQNVAHISFKSGFGSWPLGFALL